MYIYFDYSETLMLKVKYMFITVFRYPPKPKKPKKPKKTKPEKGSKGKAEDIPQEEKPEQTVSAEAKAAEKTDAVSEAAAAEKPKKEKKPKKQKKPKDPRIPTLPEIFELVKVLVDSLGKPLKKMLRRIKICDLRFGAVCGGEDAAKAALNFGKMNVAVGNALGFLGSFFTLKDPQIDIKVDFQAEETKMTCSCLVKCSLLTMLAFAFCFLGRLIVRCFRSAKIKGYINRLRGK